ncbi:transposase, partial [Fluviibacterium sp. DFM31]
TLVKAWASMKSFQPKVNGAPNGDDDPGDPPDDRVSPPSSPDQSIAEPEPMTRPRHRSRNAEVDFRDERRSNATHASRTDPEARLFRKSPGTGAVLCFMGHSLMENRSGLIVQADLTQADGHAERRAAIDGRTTRHPGYAKSQRRRKKIEEPFGWAKTVGGMAQTMYRGIERVRARFTSTMAACNLARLPKLLAA